MRETKNIVDGTLSCCGGGTWPNLMFGGSMAKARQNALLWHRDCIILFRVYRAWWKACVERTFSVMPRPQGSNRSCMCTGVDSSVHDFTRVDSGIEELRKLWISLRLILSTAWKLNILPKRKWYRARSWRKINMHRIRKSHTPAFSTISLGSIFG